MILIKAGKMWINMDNVTYFYIYKSKRTGSKGEPCIKIFTVYDGYTEDEENFIELTGKEAGEFCTQLYKVNANDVLKEWNEEVKQCLFRDYHEDIDLLVDCNKEIEKIYNEINYNQANNELINDEDSADEIDINDGPFSTDEINSLDPFADD